MFPNGTCIAVRTYIEVLTYYMIDLSLKLSRFFCKHQYNHRHQDNLNYLRMCQHVQMFITSQSFAVHFKENKHKVKQN